MNRPTDRTKRKYGSKAWVNEHRLTHGEFQSTIPQRI